jgi:hypothetical protein
MARVALILLFVITGRLSAETRALPNLTADNLVGVWEAIPSPDSVGMANAVYRMDIAKDSQSYLTAVVGPAPYCRFVCRLVDYELKDGRVKLHFHSIDGAEPTRIYGIRDVLIEGAAVGEAQGGAISGTLKLAKTGSYPESSEPVFFKKGKWTREFERVSQDAERIIREQREKPKT